MLQTPQAAPPYQPQEPQAPQARVPAPTETPLQQPASQPAPQPAPATGPQGPYNYAPGYPAGYAPRYPMAPASQASYLMPTGGQRLGLAIASLALLIPLFALASNVAVSLMPYVPSGVAVTLGLIATALICVTVVAVNLLFNWDIIGRKR